MLIWIYLQPRNNGIHVSSKKNISTITTDIKSLGLGVYNGAKWRGQVLKLEEAKPDFQDRFKQRQEKIKEQEEKKKKRLLRWNDSEGFHAKDMTPVTDNNMGTRKGWKRGRYGRAIAVMRLKKNDGTKVKINIYIKFNTYIYIYTHEIYFFVVCI